ncbi:MAG: hypothetical protein Q8L75_10755, partial [Acidobacteriota bacterium]|nr:hypothetical protein [Acidobacteriota bacterium]
MPALRSLIPPAAVIASATGLFFSRSILDQVEHGGTVVRTAFLPSWGTFFGFAGLALLLVAGLAWWAARSRDAAGRSPHLANLVLPLLGPAVLAVPYLPVLPDRWPVLQVLAGPLVGVVWLAVAGLQVWVLWQSGLFPRPAAWPLRLATAVIFAATLTISSLAAWRLIPLLGMPGGDEPHYLVIAQSIWRDGDLDIQNNHTRGDYREYSKRELAPHYLAAGIGGVFYSVHPVLMPLLMAPVYAAAGYA